MNAKDAVRFSTMLAGVHVLYRRDFSDALNDLYWETLREYDYPAVAEAFTRHAKNPDTGRFMPLPADIVRMLEGSTQDAALVAWAKVDRAVRTVGLYRSIVFDDALIHRVLTDMGGWVQVGGQDDEQWPFVRNEFVTRYRGFRERHQSPEYPRHLVGMAESQNSRAGMQIEGPVAFGDVEQCRLVYRGGAADGAVPQVTHNADFTTTGVARIGQSRPKGGAHGHP